MTLFLPGHSLIEALDPKKELDELTRFALFIRFSLALALLTGLVLNYSPHLGRYSTEARLATIIYVILDVRSIATAS